MPSATRLRIHGAGPETGPPRGAFGDTARRGGAAMHDTVTRIRRQIREEPPRDAVDPRELLTEPAQIGLDAD